MSSVSESKKLKKTKIFDAAFGLFSDKSVHATAIDEVVKKAGVAKGTFYLYFKDKYDLLDQIVIHKTSAVLKSALEFVRNSTRGLSFPEQMAALSDYLLDYLAVNKKFASLVNKNLSACFRAVTKLSDEEFSEEIKKFTAQCAKRGYSRDMAMKFIYVIVNMVGSVGCDAVLDGRPYSIEEIRPIIHMSVMKMLV